MKNWSTKLACLLTGWNYKILNTCTEASRKQLKKYSSAMLILIILWAFIGYSFAERYVGAIWWVCLIVAFIFVVIIIQIERQIILTVGRNRWLSAFRFVIALIMAVIGSAILDQIIFKDDIEKKMIEIVDRQVTRQLPNRLTVIDSKLRDLQGEIDSLEKRNLKLQEDISRRPTINTVSTTTTTVQVPNEDGTISEIPRQTVTTTPIPNPKVTEVKLNTDRLEDLRVQQQQFTQSRMNAEDKLRKELGDKQGFLEELNAVVEILSGSTVAFIFYLILFLFLMSLELFIVMSKVGDGRSDYDLIVEHQLEQKKKTLSQLVK